MTKMIKSAHSATMNEAIPTMPRSGRFQSAGRDGLAALILLVLPVRILRMLQIPKRATAANCGNRLEIIFGRRRGRCPFESPCVPRIVTRDRAYLERADDIP